MIPLFPLRPLPSPVWPCVWCGRRQTLPPLPPTPSPTPTLADRHPTLPTRPPTPYPPPGQSLDSQGIINRLIMVFKLNSSSIHAERCCCCSRVPSSINVAPIICVFWPSLWKLYLPYYTKMQKTHADRRQTESTVGPIHRPYWR